ncbi:twin-arginine translocation signal domain-containing protein [Haladaptatus salinisoli]|uniref:twin-arginine translocation signal domain-containing protein n=1 Tax=Haladaptatus salinisoli TaxID=2884876 RepID=UPI001D0BD104|nr:twin-arginine translocation signal domain-containing protein [Haladaptatus salinisoli]
MTEREPRDTENVESKERRSFMKKGALATGALALGLGSAGSASAQGQNVLVYTYDYHPNVQFRVIQSLEQSTTVRLLSRPGGGNVPEISQPDDYNAYIIRYLLGGGDGGQGQITTFVFGRDLSLNTGSTRSFSGDASVFSSTLNLLSTSIEGGGGGGGTTTTTTTQS